MIDGLVWWLAIEAAGLIAFPVAFLALRFLPDRGYSFSKTIGLLLVSYVVWLGASAHVVPNRRLTIVLILVLLASASSYIAFRQRRALADFLKARWSHLLFLQAIFIVAYVLALFLRSHVADLSVGERPTDSGIINAISRADYFPPEDAWLSGEKINYYYFGHLEAATLSKLTAIPTRISFNLSLASVTALAALGAAGIGYNLLATHSRSRAVFLFSALSPIFYLVLSNAEGLFEMMAAHGVGSTGLYDFVGIRGLDGPGDSTAWYPTAPFWWGRANSFVTGWPDHLFPFFRLFQGELHSEVLAMPLTVLAMGVALNVWLRRDLQASRYAWQHAGDFAFAALVLGALAFTHIWDAPTYGALMVIAFAVAVHTRSPDPRSALRRTALFAAALGAGSILLFLPAYFLNFGAFEGIALTRALDATRLNHFLIMWSPALAIISLLVMAPGERLRQPAWSGPVVGGGVAAVILPWAILIVARFGISGLIDEVTDRGSNVVTVAILAALLFVVGRAFVRETLSPDRSEAQPSAQGFALALGALTLLLILGVEFYWIRDPYWVPRFNTLNKVAFLGWTMTGAAGALGAYSFLSRLFAAGAGRVLNRAAMAGAGVAAAAVILTGFVYPITATFYTTDSFESPRFLDGLRFIRAGHPGDYNGIVWLTENVKGTPVIMEAIGDSHTEYGRVSAFTGLPTVLGWPLHESWFHGSYGPQGTRREDVQRAYQSADPAVIQGILARYDVEYVYVGPLERQAYGEINLGAFASFMEAVYENEEVTIFRLEPGPAQSGVRAAER